MTLGLEYFFPSLPLYYFNIACELVVACGAGYLATHELLKTCGSGLPLGTPFFKQKQE